MMLFFKLINSSFKRNLKSLRPLPYINDNASRY